MRWVSPRGTIEVLDDYPYWVAQKYGYFGDIDTTLEPGPMEATATIKLVDQGQADMGFPSPGVFSLGLEQGIPLVSVWHMGAYDVFDFAFRQGEKPADVKELEGKTILLGSAGWQAIVDPMLAQIGVAPDSVNYAEAGNLWGQALMQGQGDAALSWEGLRAQWKGQGLDLRLLPRPRLLAVPGQQLRDPPRRLRGSGEEGAVRGVPARLGDGPRVRPPQPARRDPHRARAVPGARLDAGAAGCDRIDDGARERVPRRLRDPRGLGLARLRAWQLFFDTIHEIGQISKPIAPEDVLTNDYVAPANDFDHAKVKADADSYELPEEFEAIDVEAIRARI